MPSRPALGLNIDRCITQRRTLFINNIFSTNPNFCVSITKAYSIIYMWNWKMYIIHTYIHTSFFRCSPQGFSATCLQQMQVSVVEGLSQTATSGSQCFFVWDIKLCPQLTVHNTGISLLLSTSVWVLLSPPIERRETYLLLASFAWSVQQVMDRVFSFLKNEDP